MNNYILEDIEQAQNQNPSTFFIPSLQERSDRKVGDMVRLHFILDDPKEGEPRAERMWVEIFEVENGKYKGYLTNQPYFIEEIQLGDEIEFEPKHIARTIMTKDDPRYFEGMDDMALVSAMLFENQPQPNSKGLFGFGKAKKLKPQEIRFLYKEEADRDEDSGWRIFTGYEDDNYPDDSNNIRLVDLGWLADFDSSLLDLFKTAKVGQAFERRDAGEAWEEVDDWNPE